jgi:hypothetical protein
MDTPRHPDDQSQHDALRHPANNQTVILASGKTSHVLLSSPADKSFQSLVITLVLHTAGATVTDVQALHIIVFAETLCFVFQSTFNVQ